MAKELEPIPKERSDKKDTVVEVHFPEKISSDQLLMDSNSRFSNFRGFFGNCHTLSQEGLSWQFGQDLNVVRIQI